MNNLNIQGGRPPKAKAAIEALAMALEVMRAQRKWMGERPVDPVAPYDISCALLIDALEIAIERAESEITQADRARGVDVSLGN